MTRAQIKMQNVPAPIVARARIVSRSGELMIGGREIAIAFSYNGSSHAVVVATPPRFLFCPGDSPDLVGVLRGKVAAAGKDC